MQGSPRIDELRQKFHENPRRYFAPLANEYRKAGDPEQAIAICRAHLAQQPAHMSGHVVYARALYDAGRIDESRVVFEKALSLDPDNAIVLRQLGDISRQKGDTTEARHWYTRALDADPHDREIAAYIAELTEPLTESAVAEVTAAPVAEEPVAEEPGPPEPIAEEPAAPIEEVPAEEPAENVEAPNETKAAPVEQLAAPEDVEVEIPKTEEPPALTDMPGFEADEALFAADEDVELFPDSGSPFVTRTMADLYARQGYNDQALEVYRKLAADNPHDEEIADRIRELSQTGSSPAESPTPSETPVHFTDTELGAGDEWDADSWAAGFSSGEPEVVPFDFIASNETLEAADDEASPATEPPEEQAVIPERVVEEPAAQELASAAEQPEEPEEVWRPDDAAAPENEEPLFASPEQKSPYAEGRDESPYAEVVQDSPYAEAEQESSDAEPEHFVAYSPQPPDDEDLPHYTPVGPTIREFFATLGAYRAPENGAGASFTARAVVPDIDAEPLSLETSDTSSEEASSARQNEEQPADEFPLVSDAFANLFPDSPVSEEDSKAAFALSGALSSQPSQRQTRTQATPPSPSPAVEPQPGATRESEEDIRRFREWLDGLAES
jgi:tetratricopeptide (TPR) repeat protein